MAKAQRQRLQAQHQLLLQRELGDGPALGQEVSTGEPQAERGVRSRPGGLQALPDIPELPCPCPCPRSGTQLAGNRRWPCCA